MKFSNPRTEATIEDWPHGRKRVTAKFFVETNKRGSRVGRTTTGKPKYTTYHRNIVLMDGDDGRIYAVGLTEYNQVVVWEGTLKTTEYFYDDSEEYAALLPLLTPKESS